MTQNVNFSEFTPDYLIYVNENNRFKVDISDDILVFNDDQYDKYWDEFLTNGHRIRHWIYKNGTQCIEEYNDRFNIIHCWFDNGHEWWAEHDEYGNVLHFKNTLGYEFWQKFDNKGNKIYYKDTKGIELSGIDTMDKYLELITSNKTSTN